MSTGADNDPENMSLTPLLENSKLVIPPSLLQTDVPIDQIEGSAAPLILSKNHQTGTKKQPKTRPAFVNKLWTMVNDESNHELISWSSNGEFFIVKNREQFVSKVLPKYFKHSNFASFVRQLNMYGWHKVHDVNSGSIHAQGDENWSFSNPNFKKEREDLLENIVRNKPTDENANGNGTNGATLDKLDVGLLINELNVLKNNQAKITQELSRVRQDNELLWTELFQTREKNTLQNDKIEKILQFLASVYGNRVKQLDTDNYMNYIQPQLDNSQFNQDQQVQQYHHPVRVSQLPPNLNNVPSPSNDYNKPRLMLKQNRHVSNSSQQSPNSSISITPKFPIDESPIQEIIRTPIINSYDEVTPFPTYPDELSITKQTPNLSNAAEFALEQGIDLNSAVPAAPQRPPLIRKGTSVSEISKSIEQQGQYIDDLISKLSQQQTPTDSQNDAPSGVGSNFDLNEYLDQDFIGDNSSKPSDTNSEVKASLPSESQAVPFPEDTPNSYYNEYPDVYTQSPALKQQYPYSQGSEYGIGSPSVKSGTIQEINETDNGDFDAFDPTNVDFDANSTDVRKHGLPVDERRTRSSKKRRSDG